MKTGMKALLSAVFCVVCLVLGTVIGSAGLSLKDTMSILGYRLFGLALPEHISNVAVSILWTIRLPRVVAAFLVGAALSVSGAVMQSVLRNPLASSYTLGVSSGASLAAAAVLLSGIALPLLPSLTRPAAGFIGGMGTVFLAMGLAVRFDRNMENVTIILTGMVLGLFVNAFLTILTALSGDHLRLLVFWQMGSFGDMKWRACGIVGVALVVCLTLLVGLSREMDLMTFGEEQALSAGVQLKRVKSILLLLSTLLTGAAVSFAGIIGFADLIVPHVTRRLFGSRHRVTLPMNALLGGGFMVLADLIARTVMAPRELPVGAITALVGAPFFAWIYFHRRGGARHD